MFRPSRGLIVFVAFAVIAVTSVGQGLSLPALVRRLEVVSDEAEDREEALARRGGPQPALRGGGGG
jgi:NhaP-type Na+/H+ or K+/H+ antiporter